jgi:hypothetical protein
VRPASPDWPSRTATFGVIPRETASVGGDPTPAFNAEITENAAIPEKFFIGLEARSLGQGKNFLCDLILLCGLCVESRSLNQILVPRILASSLVELEDDSATIRTGGSVNVNGGWYNTGQIACAGNQLSYLDRNNSAL